MKTINVQLSEAGIQQAIKEIDEWNKQFQERVREFAKRLADEGCHITQMKIFANVSSEYKPDTVKVYADASPDGNLTYKVSYYMEGREAIFIEFGAGVYYNGPLGSSRHPKAGDMNGDVTIGSWSFGPNGKGLAGNDGWFYGGRYTHGTPTFMPMYSGAQELAQKIQTIAKEVFNG